MIRFSAGVGSSRGEPDPTGQGAGTEKVQFASRWLFIVFRRRSEPRRFHGGRWLQAPAGSPQDHQPRDLTRGRRRRTPLTSTDKLRLTRRAWLLLWLIATLIALADGGLLIRGTSATVTVEGRSRSVPAGLTVEQALERLALPAMAGDLLAVDHSILRKAPTRPRCWSTATRRQPPDGWVAATESRWPAAAAGWSR